MKRVITCLVAAAACAAAGCRTTPPRADANASPTPPAATTPAPPPAAASETPAAAQAAAPAPSPTAADVEAALERVYKRAVLLDGGRKPAHVAGDFNADGSEDLAAAVRPGPGGLAEINSEFANWIVADPRRAVATVPKQGAPTPAPDAGPVKVARGDSLLVIIHGYGPGGWRDAGATQSYLLRNAAGAEMQAVPLKGLPASLKVKEKGANPRADAITMRLEGVAGFVYWARGKYAWQEE